MTTSRRSRYAVRHLEERAAPFFHRTRDTTEWSRCVVFSQSPALTPAGESSSLYAVGREAQTEARSMKRKKRSTPESVTGPVKMRVPER